MSDPTAITAPRAVFLSYAREDADQARRIAEAMRAFGVEVWFDQNELRGGDAWDTKIRNQIKTCALFVPLISQRTEERAEGYASSAASLWAKAAVEVMALKDTHIRPDRKTDRTERIG